jgi:hypothetical protein
MPGRVAGSLLPGLDGVAVLARNDLDAMCAAHVIGLHLEHRVLIWDKYCGKSKKKKHKSRSH